MKIDWVSKLTSRKFWVAIAAMLSSIGTTIAGLQSDSPIIVVAGIICTAASSAAYAVAEAIADAARAQGDIYLTEEKEPPDGED